MKRVLGGLNWERCDVFSCFSGKILVVRLGNADFERFNNFFAGN